MRVRIVDVPQGAALMLFKVMPVAGMDLAYVSNPENKVGLPKALSLSYKIITSPGRLHLITFDAYSLFGRVSVFYT